MLISNSSAILRGTPVRRQSQSVKTQIKRSNGKQNINPISVINIQLPKELRQSRASKEFSSPSVKMGQVGLLNLLRPKTNSSPYSSKRKPLQSLLAGNNVSQFSLKGRVTQKVKICLHTSEKRHLESVFTDNSTEDSKHQRVLYCQRHGQKRAKYSVEVNHTRQLCCRKCAITLAAQGYKTIQLKLKAGSEVERVLSVGQQVMESLRSSIRHIQRQTSNINYVYQQEHRKMTEYYQRLMDQLRDMSAQSGRSLLLAKERIKMDLDRTEESLKAMCDQVETIQEQAMSVQTLESDFANEISELNKLLTQIQQRVSCLQAVKVPELSADHSISIKLVNFLQALSIYKLQVQPEVDPFCDSALKSRQSQLTFGHNSPSQH